MLIVIPTYRRNNCLKWVLQSLIQCTTDSIAEPIRVVVVNNYPPAGEEIRIIVDEFSNYTKFAWDVLYRQHTLPPAENWYSAILELADHDEVVFINSDDDIFFPWGLENRFNNITALNADLLLAEIDHGLFFSEKATRCYCLSKFEYPGTNVAHVLDFADVLTHDPQHLSNHCYRNTHLFRSGLRRAMGWCHDQDWLDYSNRTLFITLYLPLAILLCGGTVVGYPQKCIIRGRDIEEIKEAKYGVPSWNHGFLALCALGVLNNEDLKEIKQLESVRSQCVDEFTRWFITCLWDYRVGRSILFETIRRVKFPVFRLLSLKTLYGLGLVLKDSLGIRGVRLQRVCKTESVPTEMFLRRLECLLPDELQ